MNTWRAPVGASIHSAAVHAKMKRSLNSRCFTKSLSFHFCYLVRICGDEAIERTSAHFILDATRELQRPSPSHDANSRDKRHIVAYRKVRHYSERHRKSVGVLSSFFCCCSHTMHTAVLLLCAALVCTVHAFTRRHTQ